MTAFRKFSAPATAGQITARIAVAAFVTVAFVAVLRVPPETHAERASPPPVRYVTLPRVVIEGKRERVELPAGDPALAALPAADPLAASGAVKLVGERR